MKSSGAGEKQAHIPVNAERQAVENETINPELIDPLFASGGEMGALMRAFDWSKSLLGPVEHWSPALRMMTNLLLANRFPMLLWWGPQFCQLYNDAYIPVLGDKHPQAALGKPFSECWSEVFPILEPLARTPFEGGPATWMEDIPLEVNRFGFMEETHFTIAYSPVPDETAPGGIGGVLATVHEISAKVVGERRTMLLRDLGAAVLEERTAEQACARAAEVLAKYPKDVPFALLYLLDSEHDAARLAGSAGVNGDECIAPAVIDLGATSAVWPLSEVLRTNEILFFEDLKHKLTAVPSGPWSDPPNRAAIVPVRSNVAHRLAGFLVAGLSPRLRFDDSYKGFLELTASQIATAVNNARAYEEERRRAQALAEIDRAKTAFFSNVSHEFRTPLTLMLGPLAEVLSDTAEHLSPEGREQLVVVRRNALRLLKLVNTLLDFSRIEAGRVDAVYESTDLCRLTHEVSSVFRSAMERAGLTFTVDCEPISETAYVDRDMWEKIVLNLLSNAFKFTFEGGVAVRLHQIGDSVRFSVADTGTGISEEDLPRIFERFHRVENVRARTFEGTGIGLALVQELAKFHGGTVEVVSSVGRGSTFTVVIPLGKDHLPADRVRDRGQMRSAGLCEGYLEEAQRWLPGASGVPGDEPVFPFPSVGASQPEKATRRELILVADDNADMREYVAHLLRDKYRVQAVSDGTQAIEAARQLHPDLVLADVMMPGIDGFGVVHAIRNDAFLSATPVILLSARAGEESRIEGLDAGANDYLVKPFTARELLARVASHLAMSKILMKESLASQRLAAIVESADDAIVSKDLNGVVTSWNRAAERMFGYRAEEMVGRSIMTIIPPELHEDEPRILRTIARGERIDHFETVRLRKSGERIQVSLTISPVKDESGRIVGAAKIARDITEQKNAERALRTSERLASVGRLAATIAHEINNPLEAVTNLVYLAKQEAKTRDVQNYLSAAEEELERISHLTKQTLGFYRDTREAEAIRIGAMLDPLVSVFAGRVRNKAVEIRTEIDGDPEIYAVAGEMRQLITNVLSNSIDAVPSRGRIRVRVSAATEWSGRRRSGVRLTVADSGCGIAREIRSRLFEPFFTTKQEVGTGLGLWVCKGIVERHHGSIRVKSSTVPDNSWTALSVFLPSEKQESVAQNFRLAG